MNINLCTDAPKHNLALMKISTYHKKCNDKVFLNGVGVFDLSYGSWLFEYSQKQPCDIEGGPYYVSMWMRRNAKAGLGQNPLYNRYWKMPTEIEKQKPDYTLYGSTYSLGYTWSYCFRNCDFCMVPKMNNSQKHNSIWDFHDSKFKEICLLNNNTFSDPKWKETFEEIWDANLKVRDENGYDLRLIDEEKADALRKTKFDGRIHYAWDLMEDESKILHGLKLAPKGTVYVLVGFNTSEDEDLYRCQKIHEMGFDPYIMPFNGGNKKLRNFKRFIDSRMYRKYKTLGHAWKDWRK